MAEARSDRCVNWGTATLGPNAFQIIDDTDAKKPVFELPYKKMQSVAKTKTDVIIETKCDITDLEDDECMLCEVRFTLPPTAVIAGKPEGKTTGEKTHILASHFEKKMVGGEDIELGDMVTALRNITLLAPRGVFTFELHGKQFKLEGRTSKNAKAVMEWLVPMKTLMGMYLLDASHKKPGLLWLCLCLSKAIRSGNQTHSCLVVEIGGEEVDAEDFGQINLEALTEEQKKRKTKTGDVMLTADMRGDPGAAIPRIFQGLSGADIIKPIAGKDPIACSDRAGKMGHLYLMEKSILFVPSPAVSIRLDNIELVTFDGISGGAGTAQVVFKVKATTHTFAGLEKADVPNLVAYVKAKNLPVTGLEVQPIGPLSDLDSSDASDQGSYSMSGVSEDSEDPEPKAKKAKKEKKSKKEKKEKKSKKEKK
ncbi:FACT complex subunit Ssrp1 [Diplonema papillatum]|nr:FACT complex subunit Ssrp1 [Diplonema papillatum]